jgi:hypothetical protein
VRRAWLAAAWLTGCAAETPAVQHPAADGASSEQRWRNLESPEAAPDQQALVMTVIKEHIGEISVCAGRQHELEPGRQGKVVLKWHVAPTGAVDQILPMQDGDTEFARCLLGVVNTLSFAGIGPNWVVFPFKF